LRVLGAAARTLLKTTLIMYALPPISDVATLLVLPPVLCTSFRLVCNTLCPSSTVHVSQLRLVTGAAMTSVLQTMFVVNVVPPASGMTILLILLLLLCGDIELNPGMEQPPAGSANSSAASREAASAPAAGNALPPMPLFTEGRTKGHYTKILPKTNPPTARCNHCGDVLAMPNSATTSLWRHLKRANAKHPKLSFESTADTAQPKIQTTMGTSSSSDKKDDIALAFAECNIPLDVIDNPTFRAAFGASIPPGFDRKELQTQCVELAAVVEKSVRKNA